ncbi:MAG: hypothetical protein FWG98_11840 [Candidatus Cloacimonetes bacterium]|nr:hypothetical protein [Candidatus Cloacimonadota bacterium]
MNKKRTEIKERNYVAAWTSIFSITMFFIAFFNSYLQVGHELTTAFVKSIFVLIVAHIIANILIFVWRFVMPKEQWLLIVHGPPDIPSRSQKRSALLKEMENRVEELDLGVLS